MTYASIEDRRAHDRWYNEHKRDKEARRDALRRWRAANPERNKELNRLSDERHPDRVIARRKVKYAKNKEAQTAAFANDQILRMKALFAGVKCRAKKTGVPFDLTFEEITFPDICPVLGIKMNYALKGIRKRGDDSPSFDRTRPELGYTKGNVVVMSWRANRIKYDTTIDELQKLAVYMRKVRSN